VQGNLRPEEIEYTVNAPIGTTHVLGGLRLDAAISECFRMGCSMEDIKISVRLSGEYDAG
jgi:hypothetical protein